MTTLQDAPRDAVTAADVRSSELDLDTIKKGPVDATVLDVEKTHDDRYVDLAANAHYEAIEFTEAESKAVLRKIDRRIVPMVVFLCTSARPR